MKKSFYRGVFEPTHKEKYIGTCNPHYDSSWELKVYSHFDRNPNVIKWGAQISQIHYFDPVKNKLRRYIVDVYVQYRDRKGSIIEELIEIKPYKQTCEPKPSRGKKKSTLLQEQLTWTTNNAKWAAAAKYCKERRWTFRLLTEKDIF